MQRSCPSIFPDNRSCPALEGVHWVAACVEAITDESLGIFSSEITGGHFGVAYCMTTAALELIVLRHIVRAVRVVQAALRLKTCMAETQCWIVRYWVIHIDMSRYDGLAEASPAVMKGPMSNGVIIYNIE